MNVQKDSQTVYVDIDDTLIMWDEPKEGWVKKVKLDVPGGNPATEFYLNMYNYTFMRKLMDRGYTTILWSKSGADWCERVARGLGITGLVFACLKKPDIYIDDYDYGDSIGKRVWYSAEGKRATEYGGEMDKLEGESDE